MSDPTTSGSANVGDTTYSWLSTAIGDILYATRASGWRERILIGPQVQRVFAALAHHGTSDPLEQLRQEQRTLEQARLEEAALQDQARNETERQELQQALDTSAITPETYVRSLADQTARHATPPPSLQDRLNDHRILARLEQDLQVGRVGQILDAAGSERSPGTDDAVLLGLEAVWQGAHLRPAVRTTPPWTARPHGHLPAATLARQLSWLKRSLPNLIGQAESADAEAAALTADAEHGRGPTARAVRQGIQAGRAAADAEREAAAAFQSAKAHMRRSLALHQAADDAERRAHASPTHLLLRGTTPAAQRRHARELRAQAELAKSTAADAIAAATSALTRARTLRPTSSRQLWHPTAADQLLQSAVDRDLQDADGPAADLRSAAVRLRAKAAEYQDHLEQLTAEASTRSRLDPRQRMFEDLERETQHRQRQERGTPARTGRLAERRPRADRHPKPPTAGPSPN
ncbi:hypothetical protein ACFC58_38080 [Kitasatospora purpeofusca]|uniref:hypothetical protein n=1 Tax=Kitasatospora purpeofusca TaxID=67352 RepID=UPI0035DD8098